MKKAVAAAKKDLKPKAKAATKGKVSRDDDESLSDSGSEVGWDSDEDQFITGTSNKSKVDRYGEEEDDYDDEESGGMLLSDLLAKNVNKVSSKKQVSKKKDQIPDQLESEPEQASRAKKEKSSAKMQSIDTVPEFSSKHPSTTCNKHQQGMQDVEDDSDDDEPDYDEDDDVEEVSSEDENGEDYDEGDDNNSDEAERSGDEDMQNEDEDKSQEDSYQSEGDTESDDEAHNRLVASIISKFSNTKKGEDDPAIQSKFKNQLMPESSTMTFDENLSLNALLGELQDAQGLEAIKSTLHDLDKKKSVPKYVEKVVANRLERKEVYQSTKGEMDKWHETVISNRHAPVLDLANDKRQTTRAKDLVNKFKPMTEMEKEIQMVLVKSGSTEAAMEQKEVEMLQSRNISLEEIKHRQAELAKVNALMFYEQMKRHRINKIKSKAYRSIRRKQKRREQGLPEEEEQLEGLENEETAELDEQNAYDRVKERMDLKHKNTSKWAKMALEYGHTDKSLRDAYHESVRLGQELTKKMKEKVGGDDENDSDGVLNAMDSAQSMSVGAKAEFKKMFDEENGEGDMLVNGKFKKLFEMDFMKKATEQQKLRAREEAQQVLKEIEALEGGGFDSDPNEGSLETMRKGVSVEERKAAKQVVGAMFNLHDGSGFQLNFLASSIAGSTPVTEKAIPSQTATATSETLNKKTKKEVSNVNNKTTASANKLEESANPWLEVSTTTGNSSGKKRGMNQLGVKSRNISDEGTEEVVVSIPDTTKLFSKKDKNTKSKKADSMVSSSPGEEVEKKVLSGKTQQELVQMAFAGPDFEADFIAHKQQDIDRELGLDEKKLKILKDVKAGWGDWAGPGGMEVSKKILDKRNRLIMQVQKENETKRLDRKDAKHANVMISERRITNAAKYKISEVPYPFKTREEYERSLQMPLGEEWNAAQAVNNLTQSDIKKRSGRIIEPIKLPKRQASANAQSSNGSVKKKQKTTK